MRAPTFTEKLLAYHTRFERHLLLLRLHGTDRTEAVLPVGTAAKLRQARREAKDEEPQKRAERPGWH